MFYTTILTVLYYYTNCQHVNVVLLSVRIKQLIVLSCAMKVLISFSHAYSQRGTSLGINKLTTFIIIYLGNKPMLLNNI